MECHMLDVLKTVLYVFAPLCILVIIKTLPRLMQ